MAAFPFTPTPISGYDFGAPMPAGGWSSRFPGQSFGWTTHLGTDFGTPAGEAIVAPAAGEVTFQTGVPGYGNLLTEKFASGWRLLFGHVAAGASGPVQAGQQIGITGQNVGSSVGSVTLVQLLDPAGKAVNPDPYINALSHGEITPGNPITGQPARYADVTGAFHQLEAAPGALAQSAGQSASGLVNINVPDPVATLQSWTTNLGGSVVAAIKDNIIPLVVAAIIIVIVLGTSRKPAASSPPIVPVPV